LTGGRTSCLVANVQEVKSLRVSEFAVSLNRSEKRSTTSMSAAKSYEEIIDFIAAGTTPEAVLAFRPSDAVQRRVTELV